MDCDLIELQKRKSACDGIGQCLGYEHAEPTGLQYIHGKMLACRDISTSAEFLFMEPMKFYTCRFSDFMNGDTLTRCIIAIVLTS